MVVLQGIRSYDVTTLRAELRPVHPARHRDRQAGVGRRRCRRHSKPTRRRLERAAQTSVLHVTVTPANQHFLCFSAVVVVPRIASLRVDSRYSPTNVAGTCVNVSSPNPNQYNPTHNTSTQGPINRIHYTSKV